MDHQYPSPGSKPYVVDSAQEKYDNRSTSSKDHGEIKKSAWARLNETWIWEFFGFLIAAGCLAATVLLLRLYDRKLVPTWPVTLNFVLSLLGNVGFAGTLFGVHAAVAQLKWIWFTKGPRPLMQLAIFQKARGGPLGAIQLLIATGAQPVVITGSLAIILGMLWGPFTQNLIRYETGNVTVTAGFDTARLARSEVFAGHGATSAWEERYPDPFLSLNMQTILITAPSTEENLPKFFCSTGNCTWPAVTTYAFCSRCVDITPQIDLQCKTDFPPDEFRTFATPQQACTVTLPKGTTSLLVNTDTSNNNLMNVTNIYTKEDAVVFTNSTSPIFQSLRLLPPYPLMGLGAPSVSKSNFSATECTLNPCVLSLQASVSGGIYSEKIIDTFMESPKDADSNWRRHVLQPPWGPERGIDRSANVSFGLDESVQFDWSSHGFPYFDIAGDATTTDGNTGITFTGITSKEGLTRYIYNANYTAKACGSPNADTFACAMDGIADAMTKTVRNAGVLANGTGAGSAFLAEGQTMTSATFVRVDWRWILLPAAVWFLGIVTWITIAIQTRRLRLPTWREDLLPLVFLYRGNENEQQQQHHAQYNGNAHSEQGGGHVARTATGSLQHDEVLKADNHSSWAYGNVAEQMKVQLLPPKSKKSPGGKAGVMQFIRHE
ncbi:hypothetical protein B0H63DRAFT_191903 [Podospora didyma]|uniref:Uncharacterized protein n=1 Tax=Podospora didyma TaxID=330526 RepID=A0AAE0NRB2_9PEZI|nr:hypothetical protein B0H63DRAFT_191903 [Podospora didyma]